MNPNDLIPYFDYFSTYSNRVNILLRQHFQIVTLKHIEIMVVVPKSQWDKFQHLNGEKVDIKGNTFHFINERAYDDDRIIGAVFWAWEDFEYTYDEAMEYIFEKIRLQELEIAPLKALKRWFTETETDGKTIYLRHEDIKFVWLEYKEIAYSPVYKPNDPTPCIRLNKRLCTNGYHMPFELKLDADLPKLSIHSPSENIGFFENWFEEYFAIVQSVEEALRLAPLGSFPS